MLETSSDPSLQRVNVNIHCNRKEAVELLTNLANDDEFRRKFQENPEEVLSQYHIYIGAVKAKVNLPSKEELQKAASEIDIGGLRVKAESAARWCTWSSWRSPGPLETATTTNK